MRYFFLSSYYIYDIMINYSEFLVHNQKENSIHTKFSQIHVWDYYFEKVTIHNLYLTYYKNY